MRFIVARWRKILFPCLAAAATPALLGAPVEFGPPSLLPGPFLLWDASLTLRASGGYSDNPFLARVERERAPFESLGADLVILRLPTDGNSFHFFFTGDDRRYFGTVEGPVEQTFVSQADYAYETGAWTFKLSLQHLYQDQVFDLSDQGLGFGTAKAQGHTVTLTPAVRRNLAPGLWLELQTPIRREYLGAPLDSFREGGVRLILGWSYAEGSSLELSSGVTLRPYDSTPLIAADGSTIPDSNETLRATWASVRWKHYWDGGRRWSSQLQGSFFRYDDNGSGFYAYDRAGGALQLAYSPGRWTFRPTARYARYSYPVQTVDGPGTPLRRRHDFTVGFRTECKLEAKTRVFGEVEGQRSYANTSFDTYRQNWLLFGVERDF